MNITPNVAVFGVVGAATSDIKPGVFVGVGATPQADGRQKAIRVMIFAEAQRGNGEGFRPCDRPGTTMTNATVETTVGDAEGQVLTVKYKQGGKVEEKKIHHRGRRSNHGLRRRRQERAQAGANIAINGAVKKPDGSLETNRVNVGRGDIVPN